MNLLLTREYRIGNELDRLAATVGDLLAAARPYLPVNGQLEVALYEALYNAVEHGNLGLSCAEKKQLIENGRYDEFIARRQQQSPYADRTVALLLQITEHEAAITITDQGAGFDWQERLASGHDEASLLEVNGRGIRIMQSVFDEVRYNRTGNTVTLIKKRESA